MVVIIEEGASGDLRVVSSQGAHPAGSEPAAGGVDGVPGLGRERGGVDAEVLAGGEAEGEDAGARIEGQMGEEVPQLGEGLLHLVHGAGAVEQLELHLRVRQGVGHDQREQSGGLAGARGHLQQRVAAGVQSPLHLPHVLQLLRVYALVREVHRYLLHLELHGRVPASEPEPEPELLITDY